MSLSLDARRVLVFGDVNLNIIDGSSIWLTSISRALARAGAAVDVLSKAVENQPILFDAMRSIDGVRLLLPDEFLTEGSSELAPRAAARAIGDLAERGRYDVVLVRGLRVAAHVARSKEFDGILWPYLTDVPQSREALTADVAAMITDCVRGARRVLSQTEESRSFLEGTFPEAAGKTLLLPPMILEPPRLEAADAPTEAPSGPLRLVYSGKFAKDWRTLEMCELPRLLGERGIEAELTMIGSKFQHDRRDSTWHERMEHAVQTSPGVTWLGGMSRDDALREVARHDLALSWRTRTMDTSHELSTKLLEYLSVGVPPILTRTRMHEALLGSDYPGYVSDETVVDVIADLAGRRTEMRGLGERLSSRADAHTVEQAAQRLRRQLDAVVPRAAQDPRLERRLLVAGHDFKFLGEVVDAWQAMPGVALEIDKWATLRKNDEARSEERLASAQTIWCEWAGPNAVWYSRRKRPDQRLVVRLHAFELGGAWLDDIQVENVDQWVTVSEYYRDLTIERLGLDPAKVTVLPNLVDGDDLARPKLPGAHLRLGLVGIVPVLKRPERAVELLRLLLEDDPRYSLHIRGRLPNAYPWVWARAVERTYYAELFDAIARDPHLSSRISLEPFGADMASWYRKVGWVLSPSSRESFHLAPVEGMASGAIPLAWERPGAASVLGAQNVFPDTEAIARRVIEVNRSQSWDAVSADCTRESTRYASRALSARLEEIIRGE